MICSIIKINGDYCFPQKAPVLYQPTPQPFGRGPLTPPAQAPSPATPLHCDLLPCISNHDHSFPLATHKYH